MNLTTLVIIFSFLIILLVGTQYAGIGKFIENPHELKVSKGLQGLFALGICVHHIAIEYAYRTITIDVLKGFEHIGIILVGFFFFFSGYGLIRSINEKENYLKTFIKRRVWTVLVPFFICNYFYLLVTLLLGIKYTFKEYVESFLGILLLNDNMWFAVEIMIFYLAFFLICKVCKKNNIRILLMSIVVILICVYSFLIEHDMYNKTLCNWFEGEWWYNTSILFIIGMIVANYYSSIINFLKRFYFIILILDTVSFVLLCVLNEHMLLKYDYYGDYELNPNHYINSLMMLSCQTLYVISFVLLVFLLMMKFKFSNKILTFFGKISLELILLERAFIVLFAKIDKYFTSQIYIICVIGATTIMAYLINRVKLIVLEKK